MQARWSLKLAAIVAASAAGGLAGRALLPASAQVTERPEKVEHASRPARAENVVQPTWLKAVQDSPRVATDLRDQLGRPVTISCASCHANLTPNLVRRAPDEPAMKFHAGLDFAHGSLSCLSCHHAQNYNYLGLADGAQVAFSDVMTMCAQCHAPQARDWIHGAHGGMNGYWDQARGPRFRKICIDCHDPHRPAFPTMTPAFKPKDRFLSPKKDVPGGRHE